jgi:hypothetical protein
VCGVSIRLDVFPALLKEAPYGQSGETILLDDESGCFYHPNKKAVVHCDGCGRFLCSLCTIEFGDSNLCPGCIEKGAKKGSLESLKTESVYHDRIALGIAIVPILMWPITIVTAPYALYYAVRHWRTPMSVLPRVRWRSVLAILVALAQLTGWGFHWGPRLIGLLR